MYKGSDGKCNCPFSCDKCKEIDEWLIDPQNPHDAGVY